MRAQSVSAGRQGARVAGGNFGLEAIRSFGRGQFVGPLQRRQASANQQPVPQGAILFEQQNGFTLRPDARPGPRRLDFHERYKPVNFGLPGASSARIRPSRSASSQRVTRIKSWPAVAE